MTFVIIIILLIAAVGFGCLYVVAAIDRRTSKLRRELLEAYKTDELYVDAGGAYIGFRFVDDTIIYGRRFPATIVTAADLTGVEVRRNGASVTKTSRGSQITGAAVGGLAFGLAGAMVGGLSGKSVTIERIRSIGLAFTFQNREHPFHEVTFGAWPGDGVPETGIVAGPALSDLERFRAHAINMIARQ